jgi:hypothetical protein
MKGNTMTQYSEDISQVTSVWSAYGHTFIGADDNYVSCLTCGAMYQLMALAHNPSRGEYMTSAGDEPMQCTGDTSMEHGYEVDTECNCVQCA